MRFGFHPKNKNVGNVKNKSDMKTIVHMCIFSLSKNLPLYITNNKSKYVLLVIFTTVQVYFPHLLRDLKELLIFRKEEKEKIKTTLFE